MGRDRTGIESIEAAEAESIASPRKIITCLGRVSDPFHQVVPGISNGGLVSRERQKGEKGGY